MKYCLAVLLALLLSGCITFPTEMSSQVKVVWDNPSAIEQCEQLETVYGSEGHFYDFWLHSDKNMVWGALNQMRIKTAELGGDTLYLYQPLGFLGSVTMMANAYDCRGNIDKNVAAHPLEATLVTPPQEIE
ncbi:DUF4156 domain-containing protein [Shewanella sp. NIFS-20-20]|uniref:DUF4156 domain-containing protein n=1 Tax=Shewanella sp. NIFS-20-20 TaxID=2853806 RepID=UPI001C4813CB|nr:DUF4156 domain-containing protein [Shewanella sp. NIFS-20-20]MBV7314630.1 DUF4156 domain-containing protein [Shewanella sp. NIFS-20-20]